MSNHLLYQELFCYTAILIRVIVFSKRLSHIYIYHFDTKTQRLSLSLYIYISISHSLSCSPSLSLSSTLTLSPSPLYLSHCILFPHSLSISLLLPLCLYRSLLRSLPLYCILFPHSFSIYLPVYSFLTLSFFLPCKRTLFGPIHLKTHRKRTVFIQRPTSYT